MDLEDYKSQGHPFARIMPDGEPEDMHILVMDWAKANGHGEIENGGEFDYTPGSLDYDLYADDGHAHRFHIEGALNGDILEITRIVAYGPKLTEDEVRDAISQSDEACCQACGAAWADHHKYCAGSVLP